MLSCLFLRKSSGLFGLLSIYRVLLITGSLVLQISCGGGLSQQKQQQRCTQDQSLLKKRVGPEFGAIHHQMIIPLSSSLFGCVYLFSRIQEELPGEVIGDLSMSGDDQPQHEIAFVLPDLNQRSTLTILSPPSYRKGDVHLDIKFLEIQDKMPPELIIHERQKNKSLGYQGLRILKFAPLVPSPQTLFSEELTLNTTEGLKLVPKWQIQAFEGKNAVILKGGGEYKVYMWNAQVQRFILDLGASKRLKQNGGLIPTHPRKTSKPSSASKPQSIQTSSPQSKSKPKKTKTKTTTSTLNEILNDL